MSQRLPQGRAPRRRTPSRRSRPVVERPEARGSPRSTSGRRCPSDGRSAGMWATPGCRCAGIDGPVIDRSVHADVPRDAAGRTPARHSVSSTWPLPSTPATPRISPARTVKRDALYGHPAAGRSRPRGRAPPGERRRRSPSPTGAVARRPEVRRSSAPRAGSGRRRRSEAWRRVARGAGRVKRSDTRRTSSSLWLMRKIPMPGLGEVAKDRRPAARTPAATERRRLVEDQDPRLRASALSSSARCCSPTVRSSTRAYGSTSSP